MTASQTTQKPAPPEDPDPDWALWLRAQDEYGRALTKARAICPQGAPDHIVHVCARGLLEHFQALRSLKLAMNRQKAKGGAQQARPAAQAAIPVPVCPSCTGAMYDNRGDKKAAGAPDFRCKKKTCLDSQGRIMAGWVDPKKPGGVRWAKPAPQAGDPGDDSNFPEEYDLDDDDLPF